MISNEQREKFKTLMEAVEASQAKAEAAAYVRAHEPDAPSNVKETE
jgi:hypothetical protein